MLKHSSPEIPPIPTTSFRFIADYQALKDRPEEFANYFLAVNKDDYGMLLGDVIETDMIELLITGFAALANQANIAHFLECLLHLANVSRFDIAVMFLDTRSKNGQFNLAPNSVEYCFKITDVTVVLFMRLISLITAICWAK
ncbi:unnamed protein product [Gongylonema pulchrum]|uniref:RPAP3_C domain-containing protein n=1 Tax=Gongylonema pulchrum TaxID=637853 RepID=A0A183EKR0_9BILA|nr:unnamed protein product [Gongylonema pulchrum]